MAKANKAKTDILNRMGQMIRSNKLVVGVLVVMAVVASIGFGQTYLNNAKRNKSVAVLTMYVKGIDLHEKAMGRGEGVGTVDYALLNKAGKCLLQAAESAKAIGNRSFLAEICEALTDWQMSAKSVNAPILEDRVFMQRVNRVLN